MNPVNTNCVSSSSLLGELITTRPLGFTRLSSNFADSSLIALRIEVDEMLTRTMSNDDLPYDAVK